MRRIASSLSLAVIVSALCAWPAWAAVHPLSEFTVFGFTGVVIGVGSKVLGSSAGANDALVGARLNNAITGKALKMNGQALIEGDARILQDSDIANSANILGDLITLGVVHAPARVHVIRQDPEVVDEVRFGSELDGFLAGAGFPPLAGLLCPTGGADIDGGPSPNNQDRDLPPGIYGNLTFGSQFKLRLHAGHYRFQSITVGAGAQITVEPGTFVHVCGQTTLGSAKVFPTTPPPFDPADFEVFVGSLAGPNDPENAFRIGGGSQWIGNVFAAPGAGIHVGSGGSTASVFGRLVAGAVVDIEHGVTVGSTIIHDHQTFKDATLLHGAKNENNGANNALLVKTQVASVLGLDFPGALADAHAAIPVTRAVLRLFVCNMPLNPDFCPDSAHAPDGQNFTPHDWPAVGGHDTAYKAKDGFERWGSGLIKASQNIPPEGNGNNFPKDDNPRGDHLGVTWNCVIDTNIANEAQDCSGPDYWNGGLKVQETQAPNLPVDSTTLITNIIADETPVDFDVTAQFNDGIGPLDTTFITWFIRQVTGSGFVAYYSFQGSQAKYGVCPAPPAPPGNCLKVAPTLIITP